MRFERIFEDLEGRFVHHEREEMRAVSEELTRAERAQLTVADRLRGAGGRDLTVHMGPSLRLTGTVVEVGPDWLWLRLATGGSEAIVPLAAVSLLSGLSDRARPSEDSPRAPLGLGSVLRGLLRDRRLVTLETTAGRLTGRISAVGADALDLQQLPTGEAAPGRTGTVRVTVLWSALLAVISR